MLKDNKFLSRLIVSGILGAICVHFLINLAGWFFSIGFSLVDAGKQYILSLFVPIILGTSSGILCYLLHIKNRVIAFWVALLGVVGSAIVWIIIIVNSNFTIVDLGSAVGNIMISNVILICVGLVVELLFAGGISLFKKVTS